MPCTESPHPATSLLALDPVHVSYHYRVIFVHTWIARYNPKRAGHFKQAKEGKVRTQPVLGHSCLESVPYVTPSAQIPPDEPTLPTSTSSYPFLSPSYWLRSLQSSLSALPSPTMHCAHLGPSPEGSVTSLSLCSSVPSQTEMEPSYVFPLPPSANRCLIALLCARS